MFPCTQKQTEQLLNADDLDTMWVCLRENCVVDDSTGAEKVGCVMQVMFRNLLLISLCFMQIHRHVKHGLFLHS